MFLYKDDNDDAKAIAIPLVFSESSQANKPAFHTFPAMFSNVFFFF